MRTHKERPRHIQARDGPQDSVANNQMATYQVSIMKRNHKHMCSGVIVSEEWIVSTATCLQSDEPHRLKVVTGIRDLSKVGSGRVYHIDYVLLHPHYDIPKRSNDIGLAHVKIPIHLSASVSSIDCNAEVIPRDAQLQLTGWGWRKEEKNIMKTISVNWIGFEECKAAYRGKTRNPVDISHICIKIPQDNDFCNHEMGQPIVFDNKLIGLSAFGPGCSNGEPYVFTRMAFFFDFIRTKMAGCSKCKAIKGFSANFFEL
ncbi:chymotrypsin-2-like [Scaptodrosophila lebanonensis]|uniref:Chymotrypsin-2-like n=1 Tax=Drosophila lebanonensis TaxID=7225 RepID=A0A6J2TKA2_DROLE|nr:chymotrypsin-2-like [Scaptodrosophila lebanonensis]